MRRGTTFDGFIDREDHLDLYITTGDKDELMRKWHDFVELECTKRYLCTKVLLTPVLRFWLS